MSSGSQPRILLATQCRSKVVTNTETVQRPYTVLEHKAELLGRLASELGTDKGDALRQVVAAWHQCIEKQGEA